MNVTKLYVTDEEREALEWVRSHGGLDHVKAEWRSRVPYERYVRRRQSLLGHIAECETALGRRNRRISELEGRVNALTNENAELRKRAMPQGYEWPRYESGDPVGVGDEVSVTVHDEDGDFERTMAAESVSFSGHGVIISDPCHVVRLLSGERVKRPVLAADGELLEVGQTVYTLNEDRPYTVKKVEHNRVHVNAGGISFDVWKAPTYLTHQRPVLDADGVPIREGDTVWEVGTVLAIPMTVVEVSRDTVRCEYAWTDGKVYRPCCSPDTLTHAKPEIDTWQRIEEDAGCTATKYNERRGTIFTTKQQVARDLVRRCRALAERERGE